MLNTGVTKINDKQLPTKWTPKALNPDRQTFITVQNGFYVSATTPAPTNICWGGMNLFESKPELV